MTTLWRFSDGTTVELGGNVEGASLFAQHLRERLSRPPLFISIWPLPAPRIDLDLNDIAHVDRWVRGQAEHARFRDLRLRVFEAPQDIPELPPPPDDREDDEPGTVY